MSSYPPTTPYPSAPAFNAIAPLMSAQQFHTSLKGPCARVELALSATNLSDMDTFSKSDPLCVVEEMAPRGPAGHVENVFIEIGRTEWILNSLNPKWNKRICLDYHFECKQQLRFSLYDVDADTADLTKHDFLGRCECDLADIVAAPNGLYQLAIRDAPRNNRSAVLSVCATELDEGQHESLYFVCCASSLSTGSFLSRCCSCFASTHVFMEFSRILGDGSRQMVHRTEVVKNTDCPQWRSFEVTLKRLCEGDKSREFLIECFQHRPMSGNHKLIGSVRTTVDQLQSKDKQKREVQLLDARGNQLEGSVRFLELQVRQQFTFLDYISSGMQLEFAVAVDLTASNGDVTKPSSLHYINSQYMNQYECAICAVLEICEHYNQSKQFEALGFGAKIPPSFNVSHMFPLQRLSSAERTVQGMSGVMEAYRFAVANTQLYGPTNFEPTIRAFLEKCKQFPRDGSKFQVLLILTDGIITDMQKTMEAIIEASYQPIAIIIVGIGAEDFEKMEQLDSDDKLISYNGRTAVRDIVQFVPFREFTGSVFATSAAEQEKMKAALAREVLAEVPEQVTSFMKAHKIAPYHRPNHGSVE